MANEKNTRRAGFYWTAEGKPMLSVTEILKCIDKPALRYWYGQEVFYAMAKDPTLSEKDALAAPYNTGRKAAGRGSTVHSIVEAYKHTGQQIESIPDEFKGFAQAFYNFMNEMRPDIVDQEKTVFDFENRVAGTLDLYWRIGQEFHITDVKTGKDIYAESELQLSEYAHALRMDGKRVDKISVLLLEIGDDKKPTGNYKFATRTENHDVFLHAKSLYEWLNREKLIKVGYLER